MAAPPVSSRTFEWFSELFGFPEASMNYEGRRRLFDYSPDTGALVSKDKHNQVRRTFQAGKFETPSLEELRRRTDGRRAELRPLDGQPPGLRLRNVTMTDVAQEISRAENKFATFQVASQFNCLEFTSADRTPELGISCYKQDHTQGPACAIACAAGTIVRNYFAFKDESGPKGQTKDRQVENLKDTLEMLNATQLVTVQNGYTLSDNQKLTELGRRLRDNDLLELATAKVRVGIQTDTEVAGCQEYPPEEAGMQVTQVFCGTCSISYSGCSPELWELFAQLVLEADFEATLLAALETALRHPEQPSARRVFLFDVGGGVFGNLPEWIAVVRDRVLRKFKDVPLEVLVSSPSTARLTAADIRLSSVVTDQVRDETTKKCPHYKKAVQLVHALMSPDVSTSYYFDSHEFDRCFCNQCFQSRDKGQERFSRAGKGYYLPVGFARVAFPLNNVWTKAMKSFDDWPVFYHPILGAENVPHVTESMMILHQGDKGPFGEPVRRARSGAAEGADEVHFLRSAKFGEAVSQGYGPAYENIRLVIQARVFPEGGSLKKAEGREDLDKWVTKRRLTHICTGILCRAPEDEAEFKKLLEQYLNIGLEFRDKRKQIEELARKEGKDTVFATMHAGHPWPLHGNQLRFLPRGPVKEDDVAGVPLAKEHPIGTGAVLGNCQAYRLAKAFVEEKMELGELVNTSRCGCWCRTCAGELPKYVLAGGPARRHELPRGWCEFPLHGMIGKGRVEQILKEWQVAFHSVKAGHEVTSSIIKRGTALLKAGDTTFDGKELSVLEGHIKKAFERTNKWTGTQEKFDPTGQFFASPRLDYIDNSVYLAKSSFKGKQVSVVLKLRLRPGSYTVGQSTTPSAAGHGETGWDDRLEYYSDRYASHYLESLLVRVR